ncbi:MAG: hypothetical protein LBO09_01740 [Candidatus Peribacteria bacterium]|jgi:hypothetical protein|nr:hypothetical protein [Candidatus Peribacteria bacterium]
MEKNYFFVSYHYAVKRVPDVDHRFGQTAIAVNGIFPNRIWMNYTLQNFLLRVDPGMPLYGHPDVISIERLTKEEYDTWHGIEELTKERYDAWHEVRANIAACCD